ncbi:hypothetical protein KA005_34080, partial [bacterium]|nr:hypothetical protein [bacterium]
WRVSPFLSRTCWISERLFLLGYVWSFLGVMVTKWLQSSTRKTNSRSAAECPVKAARRANRKMALFS